MSTIKVADLQHLSNSNDSISIASDSSVTLKHSGNSKLTTTASGVNVTGSCTATSFAGDGANLTNLPVDLSQLNADNLSSGTIPNDRFPATLPAVSGANLTNINAGALQHVADYVVPAGQTVARWTPITTGSLQNDTRYYLRAHFGQNSAGGHLRIEPHIFDSNSNTQYTYSSKSYTLDTSTHYYGGQTGNQSSGEWVVYEGGYYTARFNFELWFHTYTRPHAQSRLFGDDNISAICHGNHIDTSNKDFRRINGLTFSNNWGYYLNDKSRISLYKYSNY